MVTFTFTLEDSYFEKLDILKKAEALKDPEYKEMSFNSYAELLLECRIREKISKLKAENSELYSRLIAESNME